MKPLICLVIAAALSGCSQQQYDPNRAAMAAMMLGAGLQNYGTARASYQPVYQTTSCYPVGRGFQCW